MSDIIGLHSDVAAYLTGLTMLRGVTCLSVDRHDVVRELEVGLSELGIAAVIGMTKGTNPAPNSRTPNFASSVGVRVIENVVLNRDRKLVATVATEVARLALNGVPGTVILGQKVRQTDVGKDYWLFNGTGLLASHWAELLTCNQAAQTIGLALHFWTPTGYQTLAWEGYEDGSDDQYQDVLLTFTTRIFIAVTTIS